MREGTGGTLVQFGFHYLWWNYAMVRYAFLANVCDQDVQGMTAHERRFQRKFEGPIFAARPDTHTLGEVKIFSLDKTCQF